MAGIRFSRKQSNPTANRAGILIGTSGWHYKHWIGRFYPEHSSGDSMLRFYMQHFNTVEVNNSFYNLPDISTFRSWGNSVPDNFRFSVKASRFITHNKKLKDGGATLERLLPRAEALGKKLGPILFQLPPHWKLNLERLESFLCTLPSHHRYTFEFRETSWNTPAVYELLRKHNAAYCIHDLAGFQSPIEITADWTYVRLHGPAGKYQGRYGVRAIKQWAARIIQWSTQLAAVYVYFDNDDSAYAPQNALQLDELVRRSLAPVRSEDAAWCMSP